MNNDLNNALSKINAVAIDPQNTRQSLFELEAYRYTVGSRKRREKARLICRYGYACVALMGNLFGIWGLDSCISLGIFFIRISVVAFERARPGSLRPGELDGSISFRVVGFD